MNFNKHNSFFEMFKATRKINKRKLIFFTADTTTHDS